MNARKPASRANGELMKGSAAMRGAMRILPIVMAFGRFNWDKGSGQRLQNELAHGLQRIEDSVAFDRDRFEVRCLLDPLAGRQLVDEILAGVIRIRSHACLCGLMMFPPRVERSLQLSNGRSIRQVALVVLHDERNL